MIYGNPDGGVVSIDLAEHEVYPVGRNTSTPASPWVAGLYMFDPLRNQQFLGDIRGAARSLAEVMGVTLTPTATPGISARRLIADIADDEFSNEVIAGLVGDPQTFRYEGATGMVRLATG